MLNFFRKTARMPATNELLPGRSQAMPGVSATHAVLGTPMKPPFVGESEGVSAEIAMFGMGCFWGVERLFWKLPGVISTHVGYAGGSTPNPTYKEVCSGRTGHNEVVRVVYNPARLSFAELMQVFWEGHNPTQGMRQGNDVGTQYRSGVYVYDDAQRALAESTRDAYQDRLRAQGYGQITTEIVDAPEWYYAEDYHQQYLHKNPQGYCGIGGTGVSCPIGLDVDG